VQVAESDGKSRTAHHQTLFVVTERSLIVGLSAIQLSSAEQRFGTQGLTDQLIREEIFGIIKDSPGECPEDVMLISEDAFEVSECPGDIMTLAPEHGPCTERLGTYLHHSVLIITEPFCLRILELTGKEGNCLIAVLFRTSQIILVYSTDSAVVEGE